MPGAEVPKEIRVEEVKGPLKGKNKDKALSGVKILYCPVQGAPPPPRNPWGRREGAAQALPVVRREREPGEEETAPSAP